VSSIDKENMLTFQPFRDVVASTPFREREGDTHRNVGDTERIASVVTGLVVGALGLRSSGAVKAVSAIAALALLKRGMTGTCPVYKALGRNTAGSVSFDRPGSIKIEESVIVNRPTNALFAYWRNLSNLPSVMRHLVSVTETDDKISHWVSKGPAGIKLEWDAEIINERENELIAWRSLADSDVASAGSVRFEPHWSGYGTIVRVVLMVHPPAGRLGNLVASLFGEDPQAQIEEDLQRFKQMMEAGQTLFEEDQAPR
jgi:uncharacterized membrane protein